MKLENKIAAEIGLFYYKKATGSTEKEKIDNAIESISGTGITDVTYSDGIACIHASRPGLLIGYKGENIKSLTEYLKRIVPDIKNVTIEENTVMHSLYAFVQIFSDFGEEIRN